MNDSRLSGILFGSLAVGTASGFVTGIHGIITNRPNYGVRSLASAFNAGITCSTFFVVRTYAVSPLLDELKYAGNAMSRFEDRELTLSTRVLDSAISGGLTGCLLQAIQGNVRGSIPGAIFGGAVGSVLQLGYNGSRLRATNRSEDEQYSSSKLGAGVLKLFGVKKLSDEEYLASLLRKKASLVARMEDLEKRLEEENKEK